MASCIKCGRKAVVEQKHLGSFCKNCFLRIVLKRVRRELHGKIARGARIVVLNDGTRNALLARRFTQLALRGFPAKITFGRKPKTKCVLVLPNCLDDEVEAFLTALFEGKAQKTIAKNAIMPFLHVSDAELGIVAKLLKIKGKTRKKTELGVLLDGLEKKYPQIRFSALKSAEEFAKLPKTLGRRHLKN